MRAEDWHEEYWHEIVAYNKKTDELQKMDILEVCPEFQGYIEDDKV